MESKLKGFGAHHAAYSGPFFLIILFSIAPELTKRACAIDQALHIVVHVPFWGRRRHNRNSEDQWELFRPALSDLGCDIFISELTAEEIRELDEADEEDRTTHSQTPAPSTASDTSEVEGPEQIVIYEAPRSGEQELATLAESLHILAHPVTDAPCCAYFSSRYH